MLNLANSINRLNLLFQQSRLQESLQTTTPSETGQPRRSRIVTGTPQTVFLADLPKDLSLVELYEFLKQEVGDCEVVLKRPALKYFYYAFCRFPDIIQARHLLNDIKFPELIGKTCRALPYDKDLLRNCSSGSNIFVKGIPSSWTHKELHEAFNACGQIVSARVSIKDDHQSRGYGFVAFAKKQEADAACEKMDGKAVDDGHTLSVKIFVPRTERQPGAESCSNLYVKNFPKSDSGEVYSDADLRKVFENYGSLTSCKVDDSGKFGFVSFEDPAHAAKALDHLGDSDSGGLFVTKMQSKELRAKMLRLEILKSMKQVARQNLYFKGFPTDDSTTPDQMTLELREYFSKYGDVKNLKLIVRDNVAVGFGYVSFQTLEAAQKCRFESAKELFREKHKLFVNQFEWKELRSAHQMERMDQIELGRYMRTEQTKKANEVLSAVKDDLQTEQGKLLLRVLKVLTTVNQKKAEVENESKGTSEVKQGEGPAQPAQAASAQSSPNIMNQAYAVRFQTLITSQSFREGNEVCQKQLIGAFMFEHVKMFIDQAAQMRGQPSPSETLGPKITGMIMSLPHPTLLMSTSTYEGLFQKVHEAMTMLMNSQRRQQQIHQQQV